VTAEGGAGEIVSRVGVERVVRAPPAEVFDHVAAHHFENHPRWDPDVVEMKQTSPGAVGVGTTASVVRRQGKRRVEGVATVTAYEPVRSAAWRVDFGQFQLQQDVAFVPEEAGAVTRLSLGIETTAHGLLRLLLPLMRPRFRSTMERSVASIAALVEPSTQ
jgi:Polyketide cyclase / dehydrase and lipid transport